MRYQLAAAEKPKSLAREVLPVVALVVGIPLIVWFADSQKGKAWGQK